MMYTLPARAGAVLLLAIVACGRPSATPASAPPDAFGAAIERLRVAHHIPGLSGLVLRGDSVLWEQSLGFRNLEASRPSTPGTLYHLASLTKPFAAVVLMQLVNEGRLRLEQPVAEFGITLQSTDTVRVWHLMSHTSEGVPGSGYRYNGDRFGRLDSVLLRASGKSFGQLFEERIRRPLGLAVTVPNLRQPAAFGVTGLDAATIGDSLAQGYDYSRASRNVPVAYPTYFGPAAGMISSPRDMARFSRALDGDQLLPPASRARMFSAIVTPRGDTLPYGLGWFVQRYGGEAVQWHYGLWTGTSTLIVRVPARRLTFVLMANNEMLSAPFRLGAGQLSSSPFAEEFFRAFVQ